MRLIQAIILMLVAYLVSSQNSVAQQNFIPLQSFFKDRLYGDNAQMKGYRGNSFFPSIESQYDLHTKIQDTSKQYYLITEHLFKKHFLEFKGKNYYLTISPVFNFSVGKDFSDTASRKLFQNTRGFHIEGDLFKNFSFSTSFYENQSRNARYQDAYFRSNGEMYVNTSDSSYISQNAVVPGLGRTKEFKGDGFDYAFAMGDIVYTPLKVLTLSAGNTRKFIGDGYRSILLSDNSFSAPNFQINYRFSPRWEFVYLRSKLTNLLRRPYSTTVESYYEPKILAVNYLSYQVTNDLSISLFEGSHYSKGDSITSKAASPLMYNPIPLLGAFVGKSEEVNSIIGLNVGYTVNATIRLYGQLAMNSRKKGLGAQVGVRTSEPFKIKNLFGQLELNYVGNGLYTGANSRLTYSHFNLPMAHVKGEGFVEGVFRVNYEWKRVYADLKIVYYNLRSYVNNSHLAVVREQEKLNGSILHNEVEVGYRFNRKMNFSVFINYIARNSSLPSDLRMTNLIGIGMKTNLIHSYSDF